MVNRILNDKSEVDAIIAVGILMKGDTMHFEYISQGVYQGLMDCSLNRTIPVINGVLTLLHSSQIAGRLELGAAWAQSAMCMMCNSQEF